MLVYSLRLRTLSSTHKRAKTTVFIPLRAEFAKVIGQKSLFSDLDFLTAKASKSLKQQSFFMFTVGVNCNILIFKEIKMKYTVIFIVTNPSLCYRI